MSNIDISEWIFLEQKRMFAFNKIKGGLCILKDYMSIIKISDENFGHLIFKSSCSNYLVIKRHREMFLLIKLENCEIESGNNLRELGQSLPKYSTKPLIL